MRGTSRNGLLPSSCPLPTPPQPNCRPRRCQMSDACCSCCGLALQCCQCVVQQLGLLGCLDTALRQGEEAHMSCQSERAAGRYCCLVACTLWADPWPTTEWHPSQSQAKPQDQQHRCNCGALTAHLQHVCWAGTLPVCCLHVVCVRLHTGALQRHIHDVAPFDRQQAAAAAGRTSQHGTSHSQLAKNTRC